MNLPHHHDTGMIPLHIPETGDFQTVSLLFRQLADTNRIRILWLLCHTEECLINIAALVGMSSPAVLHHLKLLREAGLIESRKDGKEVYYKATLLPETQALHIMIEDLMQISCPHPAHDFPENHHSHSSPANEPHHLHALPQAESHPIHSGDQVYPGYSENAALIHRIHHYLTDNLAEHISIEKLSELYHINTTTLKKLFKEAYGLPIAAYMKKYRMKTAAALLTGTLLKIGEISESVGYTSHSRFSEAFKEFSGMLPGEYRRLMASS